MLEASYGGALIAGLLSFVSPCVLPIVPAYLAYLTGLGFDDLKGARANGDAARRLVVSAAVFVLGFSTIFIALGATASLIGQTIARHLETLSIVAGVIIVALGLHFLGVFRVGWLYRDLRFQPAAKPAGILGVYVVGLAFAFGWTPCVGPVLAAILFMAGAESTAAKGATLLAVYSAGMGIPFILAALFVGPFIGWATHVRKYMRQIEVTTGGILIITGILFMTGQMANIANWLLKTFPVFSTIG